MKDILFSLVKGKSRLKKLINLLFWSYFFKETNLESRGSKTEKPQRERNKKEKLDY